jgi:dipeptidyl aminopeptidase/acylaminoacyl peptidase
MTAISRLRIALFSLAPMFVGGAVSAQAVRSSTQAHSPKEYTIEQFLNTVAIAGASFSSDESRILFSSNKTGVWNVYSLAVTGGEFTPVTTSTIDSTYAVSYFPHDDRILFTRDRAGNELTHLYVRTPDGQERDLTAGDKLKAAFAGWTRDGTAFYVSSNERDQRFFDLYRYDAKSYDRVLFYQNDQGYLPMLISGDARWVALAKPNTTNDADIYIWDATTKTVEHITAHKGQVNFVASTFDPASRYLYYLTDEGSEFTRLKRYGLADGRHEEVQRADWDILFTLFSHNGRYRVTGINEDGRVAISVIETASGRAVALPSIPQGGVRGIVIARSESKLAFYVNADRSPSDLHVLQIGTGNLTKLTRSLNPEIDSGDLVDAQVVRFKARDGMTIPNVLWKPHQATPAGKAPALVLVHGGPGGQALPGYNALVQFLVNHGYVVLDINNRGSSGYGKTFVAADDKKHGREPLWDCVDARKFLSTLPYVDASRIGIMGGSYGGYMVLAALAFQPDAFDVGVDLFGISNWVRTIESMPAWWGAQRTALLTEIGDPQIDRQMLLDVSPLFHADRIRKPLMVLQGANDPRVIKVESDDIVAAAKKNGVPVEYLLFADEGHGFTKKKNQIEGWGAVLRFLDQHLKARQAGTR